MKLRIEGNSIRLRLRRSEVALLAQSGRVEEEVNFPQGHLIYALELKSGINSLEANFSTNRISIYIPEAWGIAWRNEDRVGFTTTLAIPNNQHLELLVEKDFVCLDRDLTQQKDQFPHPKLGKS